MKPFSIHVHLLSVPCLILMLGCNGDESTPLDLDRADSAPEDLGDLVLLDDHSGGQIDLISEIQEDDFSHGGANRPLAPEDPEFTDWNCPAGWTDFTVEPGEPWEFSACRPPERVNCAGSSAQFASDTGCLQIGTDCPQSPDVFLSEEDIMALAPDALGTIIYVNAADTSFTDNGTRSAPYKTIYEALNNSNPGDIITLAAGEYNGMTMIDKSISLVGSCLDETILFNDFPSEDVIPTILVSGSGGVLLSNFTVKGPQSGILVTESPAPLTISSLKIDGVLQMGLFILGDQIEVNASDIIIQNTVSVEDTSSFGTGIMLMDGASLVVERGLISHNESQGVFMAQSDPDAPNSSLTLHNVIVSENGMGEEEIMQAGIFISEAGDLTANQLLIHENHGGGLLSYRTETDGSNSMISLNNVQVLRNYNPEDTIGLSNGIVLETTYSGTFSQVIIEDHPMFNLIVSSHENALSGHTLDFQDLIIWNLDPDHSALDTPGVSSGVSLGSAGQITLERALLKENYHFGMIVNGTSEESGVLSLELSDVLIKGTRMNQDGTFGQGFAAVGNLDLSFNRLHLTQNHTIGMIVYDTNEYGIAPTITGHDLTISHTDSNLFGYVGRGLEIQSGAVIDFERVLISGNREGGLLLFGQGDIWPTMATFRHLTIENTQQAVCGEVDPSDPTSCIEDGINYGGGSGIIATDGALVSLDQFIIETSELTGLGLWPHHDPEESEGADPQVSLASGQISNNNIGVYMEVDSPDSALTYEDDVFLFDNQVDFSFDSLPPPVPTALILDQP